ncbi:MAG: N-acetylmuramoyl-L-alanine amidase [Anaerolineae bacterium]|nr:N-acetylmuramoyl-L-alanine amidase [Anaerolineae bacterium]
MTKQVSRREFLGLAGMTTVAGGLTCSGGFIGYITLRIINREYTRAAAPDAAPALAPTATSTPASTRPSAVNATVKQIDRPAITPRAEWGALEPDHEAVNENGFYSLDNVEGWREYEGDLRDIYRTVVVHHAAEYVTDDVTTMQYIQLLHMGQRQWADIGYHFGVGRTGQIFEGRDLAARGAHTEGYNTGSVGVVFLGHFEEYAPTVEQLDAGRRLIDWLALRLELTHLAGHHDFNDFTECPGKYMMPSLLLLADSAGLIYGTGGYQPPPEQLITPAPEG